MKFSACDVSCDAYDGLVDGAYLDMAPLDVDFRIFGDHIQPTL